MQSSKKLFLFLEIRGKKEAFSLFSFLRYMNIYFPDLPIFFPKPRRLTNSLKEFVFMHQADLMSNGQNLAVWSFMEVKRHPSVEKRDRNKGEETRNGFY